MKRIELLIVVILVGLALQGCTSIDEGKGTLILETTEIYSDDNELEISTEGIDESKVSFIYVANKKVLEQKLENGEEYTLNIEGIKDAHRTDYKPKVQLMQFEEDNEEKDMTTFKQARYRVAK